MANITLELPDEISKKITELGRRTDEITAKALEAGANAALPIFKKNLGEVVGKDTKYPSRSTGELEESLGVSPVKIDKDGIITKGDNNIFPDVSKVSKNQFFGRTLFSIPNIGVIIELFHTSKGIIFLSFMLGLLFLSGILYKIKFSGKNQKHISPGDQH